MIRDKGTRRLAYAIHIEFGKKIGESWREILNRLKWVRGLLND